MTWPRRRESLQCFFLFIPGTGGALWILSLKNPRRPKVLFRKKFAFPLLDITFCRPFSPDEYPLSDGYVAVVMRKHREVLPGHVEVYKEYKIGERKLEFLHNITGDMIT